MDFSDIQLLVGVGALCLFAVLMCLDGNERLGDLFRRIEAEMGWEKASPVSAIAFLSRQSREARVFLYGLPPEPGPSDVALGLVREFQRLALVHMIAGWVIWYCLIFLGAADGMGTIIKTCILLLPPTVLVGMWTLVRPWPDDASRRARRRAS